MIIEFSKRINELERLMAETIDQMGDMFGKLREYQGRLTEVRELMDFYSDQWKPTKEIRDVTTT